MKIQTPSTINTVPPDVGLVYSSAMFKPPEKFYVLAWIVITARYKMRDRFFETQDGILFVRALTGNQRLNHQMADVRWSYVSPHPPVHPRVRLRTGGMCHEAAPHQCGVLSGVGTGTSETLRLLWGLTVDSAYQLC